MPRGRIPKPTNLKILEGNPGKRPLNQHEPKPKPIRPKCPRWLDKEAKRMWKDLAPELERLGLLTIIDGAALAAACQRWSTFVDCEQIIQEQGYNMEVFRYDKQGNEIGSYIQQRPEVSIGRQALADFRAFCTEFGMTPASRSRISVEDNSKKNSSKLSGLLSG